MWALLGPMMVSIKVFVVGLNRAFIVISSRHAFRLNRMVSLWHMKWPLRGPMPVQSDKAF